ncbi:MAG: hypothetical protein HUN04_01595 [Desulfobacter sp.]|nr:MAG: hypothetical protein HUN04_01595 [Desulfobacter sp.]
MNRNKQILVVSGCILNANAKILPLATYRGANLEFLMPWLEKGAGIVQLPCPETGFLGMKRWGMTREQYDTPAYRSHCRKIIRPALLEIEAYAEAGYTLAGVAGVMGSPSCGVKKTCLGFTGGEIGCGDINAQVDRLRMADGPGVFMEILKESFRDLKLDIDFFDVPDPSPA